MTIPDYQTIMLPLLESIRDGGEYAISRITDTLATKFHLSDEEKSAVLASGQGLIFAGRVGWAKTYMKQAGLISQPRRAFVQITKRGFDVLKSNPGKLDNSLLQQFPEFQEFKSRSRAAQQRTDTRQNDLQGETKTPRELLEASVKQLSDALTLEVLEKTRNSSPQYFERIVLDLLLKMGYGGSRQEAARRLGQSGDEGIDGIISEDRLGLDVIYVQAKRWQPENVVARKVVDEFKGALDSKGATKGVLITTSRFNDAARKAAESKNYRIVLIDGAQLADLMIQHNVGVATSDVFELKRVDSDYFEEE